MSESARVFSLQKCVLVFGSLIMGGFGEGDAITIEPASDDWTATEGVDGSTAFSDSGSSLFNCKVKLLQTSPNNGVFTAVYQAQRASKIAIPFFYKDIGGADLFKSSRAMIQKMPSLVRGSKISTQEWPILAADGFFALGGN